MPLLPQRLLPPLALLLACLFWGAATVINKVLLGPISPVLLLSIQILPGCLLFGALTLFHRNTAPRGRALLWAAALGVLNPGVSYSLSMLGLKLIPASAASLMWATEPLMILVLASLVLREPITPLLICIVGLGLAGVWLVTGQAMGNFGYALDAMGLVAMLSAVFLCAVYTVFSRRLAIDTDPVPLLAVQQGAGLAFTLLLIFILPEERANLVNLAMPLDATGVAAVTGFMYYGLSYWLYLFALRHVPAAVAGGYFNLIPLVAIALAIGFLGETLAPEQWLGAGLIFASAVLLMAETLRRERTWTERS